MHGDGTRGEAGSLEEVLGLAVAGQGGGVDAPAAPALAEFHRILEPRGWLALVWNDRDDSDPLTAGYHVILSSTPEGKSITRSWRKSSEILWSTPWFERSRTFTFVSEQEMDEEGLIGRAFSASYAPREPARAEQMKVALQELFARFQVNGNVRMRYQVNLFVARRTERV